MGTVRKRVWKGLAVYYVDYIAATGERIRQTIGPGEEGRRLARKVLAQREAEAQLGTHRLPVKRRFGKGLGESLDGVYMMQSSDNGLIKIGITQSEQRLRSLQSQSPSTLRCLAFLHIPYGPGRLKATTHRDIEWLAHRRFAHDRVRGEWFRPSQELLDFCHLASVDRDGALDILYDLARKRHEP